MFKKNYYVLFQLIIETFSSPEQVLGKLVQKIYHTKLNSYIHNKLEEKQDHTEKLVIFFLIEKVL